MAGSTGSTEGAAGVVPAGQILADDARLAMPWRAVLAVFGVACLLVSGLWFVYGSAVFFEIVTAGLALCFS